MTKRGRNKDSKPSMEEHLRTLALPADSKLAKELARIKEGHREFVSNLHKEVGMLIVSRRHTFCIEYWDSRTRRTVRRSTGIKLGGANGTAIPLPENAGLDPCWWFASPVWETLFNFLGEVLKEADSGAIERLKTSRESYLKLLVWEYLADAIGEQLSFGKSYEEAKAVIGEVLTKFEVIGIERFPTILPLLQSESGKGYTNRYRRKRDV